MSRRARMALVAALLGAAVPGPAHAGAPRILLPLADALVTGAGRAHVLVELAAGVPPAEARVRVAGVELEPRVAAPRADGRTVVHWSLQLAPGANAIDVTARDAAGVRIRERRVVFYHQASAHRSAPPTPYQAAAFHVAQREASCAECHVMATDGTDAAPSAPEQSTCYACHAALTRVQAVHGPAAVWACTRCHAPASSPARFATPMPVMPLCLGCHKEQSERFFGAPYQHTATGAAFCTSCHDPHGADNEFFVRRGFRAGVVPDASRR